MGRWNWWLPAWAARPLRTEPSEPVLEGQPAPATESA
jgi:putative drug exporter of the RND superfamily